jgi:hypothetical protein
MDIEGRSGGIVQNARDFPKELRKITKRIRGVLAEIRIHHITEVGALSQSNL